MPKRDSQFTIGLVLTPILIGLMCGVFGASALANPLSFSNATIGLLAVGFSFFLVAKLGVVRNGHIATFGSSSMGAWQRRAYRAGYAFMVVGAVSTAILLKVAA